MIKKKPLSSKDSSQKGVNHLFGLTEKKNLFVNYLNGEYASNSFEVIKTSGLTPIRISEFGGNLMNSSLEIGMSLGECKNIYLILFEWNYFNFLIFGNSCLTLNPEKKLHNGSLSSSF